MLVLSGFVVGDLPSNEVNSDENVEIRLVNFSVGITEDVSSPTVDISDTFWFKPLGVVVVTSSRVAAATTFKTKKL